MQKSPLMCCFSTIELSVKGKILQLEIRMFEHDSRVENKLVKYNFENTKATTGKSLLVNVKLLKRVENVVAKRAISFFATKSSKIICMWTRVKSFRSCLYQVEAIIISF